MGTPAPDAVERLVDRFDQDRKVFLSGDYKEEQLRAEFLNPFFTALGWDMDNTLDTIRARNWGSGAVEKLGLERLQTATAQAAAGSRTSSRQKP